MPNAKIAQCPTPWSLEPNARRNFVDANGRYIGCCFVDAASALVVEAVNNRNGNAAALREALGEIVLLTLKAGMSLRSDVACGMIRSKARHALSAPARNCDRFATLDEARRAFQDLRGHKILADVELWDSMDEAGALVRWLFAPAEDSAK